MHGGLHGGPVSRVITEEKGARIGEIMMIWDWVEWGLEWLVCYGFVGRWFYWVVIPWDHMCLGNSYRVLDL